ncbi:hypothetical protein SG34_032760 [Thalassomonas viridans]|uniref:Uncharacterized protein n=1 Tax=Thalassomonas viridans TaxID=137584 RepID=A0AAF0CEC7_9GAMM|nr:hypothetical protein [Thalassomonas viridans]WDE08684.1 hypothetical protein SG34_032760 [Thalassomonas viridans]
MSGTIDKNKHRSQASLHSTVRKGKEALTSPLKVDLAKGQQSESPEKLKRIYAAQHASGALHKGDEEFSDEFVSVLGQTGADRIFESIKPDIEEVRGRGLTPHEIEQIGQEFDEEMSSTSQAQQWADLLKDNEIFTQHLAEKNSKFKAAKEAVKETATGPLLLHVGPGLANEVANGITELNKAATEEAAKEGTKKTLLEAFKAALSAGFASLLGVIMATGRECFSMNKRVDESVKFRNLAHAFTYVHNQGLDISQDPGLISLERELNESKEREKAVNSRYARRMLNAKKIKNFQKYSSQRDRDKDYVKEKDSQKMIRRAISKRKKLLRRRPYCKPMMAREFFSLSGEKDREAERIMMCVTAGVVVSGCSMAAVAATPAAIAGGAIGAKVVGAAQASGVGAVVLKNGSAAVTEATMLKGYWTVLDEGMGTVQERLNPKTGNVPEVAGKILDVVKPSDPRNVQVPLNGESDLSHTEFIDKSDVIHAVLHTVAKTGGVECDRAVKAIRAQLGADWEDNTDYTQTALSRNSSEADKKALIRVDRLVKSGNSTALSVALSTGLCDISKAINRMSEDGKALMLLSEGLATSRMSEDGKALMSIGALYVDNKGKPKINWMPIMHLAGCFN